MLDYEFNEIWDIISQGKLDTAVREELREKLEEKIAEYIEEALWHEQAGENV